MRSRVGLPSASRRDAASSIFMTSYLAIGVRDVNAISKIMEECYDTRVALGFANMAVASAALCHSPFKLVAAVCVAQVLVQIGAFFWPALLPGMMALWQLTNSQAG